MLSQIAPDLCLISETFERESKHIQSILNVPSYKNISYYRKNRAPGGGCAIVYNENRFCVQDLSIPAHMEIENTWALITPKQPAVGLDVKRIAVASYYISPRSRHKQETIEHIIHTIHTLRAQFNNDISFLAGGDFNRVDISDILDSYGAMHQILSLPTRKSATLEVILTDLHTQYHPPTTLPPLEVDSGKPGQNSDHNVVVFAPKQNKKYQRQNKKKIVKTRPLPESQIGKFMQKLASYPWEAEFEQKSVDEKVELFHNFLRNSLDEHFPEKITKMSTLDRKWMSPHLKPIHRRMKREYYKHRKSRKFLKLKVKFKKVNFVSNLKSIDPGKWYMMAKKIGALDNPKSEGIQVQSLSLSTDKECAQKIAEYFSRISNEYIYLLIKLSCQHICQPSPLHR